MMGTEKLLINIAQEGVMRSPEANNRGTIFNRSSPFDCFTSKNFTKSPQISIPLWSVSLFLI